MGNTYDIIVAGGGHNGLTTGAYLAKAGMNVCVLERQDKIGGGVITRELSEPGYLHDHCSTWHGLIQANPMLKNDELELLSRFGLKYIFPHFHTSVVFPDGRTMNFYTDIDKTCDSIGKFSKKDAQSYRKFYQWAEPLLDVFAQGMFNPPPPFGAYAAMMDQSDEGRELMRAATLSGLDICNEFFESDEVKIAMTRFVAEGMICPQTKGTGLMLFLFIPLSHKYGGGVPVGGSGVLSDALGRCIEYHGGTVRTEAAVDSFIISGNKVKGVRLENGEEILAKKAVVSNLNIKQMFPRMAKEAELPPNFQHKVDRLNHSEFMAFNGAICLHEPPRYENVDADINEAMWVQLSSDNLEEALRVYDDYRYGIPCVKSPLAICTTLFDKTRAPEGKHCLYLYHFEPYNLKDGGPGKWDEIGESIQQGMLAELGKWAPNMTKDNIIGKPWFTTPLDLERWNPAMVHGDIAHIAFEACQQNSNRPIAGYALRTPVSSLYMTGSSTHPGAGVTGGGRATAMAIFDDLEIDVDKVLG